MPVCPHCREDMSSTEFFANRARKSGTSTLCRSCFRVYEASSDRRAKRTWNTLHARVRLQEAYDHVEVRMSRDEFLEWALPEYRRWMSANPGLTPSLDRKDAAGHYEIGNLRILERGENARLARNHLNVHAPPGLAWCGSHRAYFPLVNFQQSKGSYNGLQARCRTCQNAINSRVRSRGRRSVLLPNLL